MMIDKDILEQLEKAPKTRGYANAKRVIEEILESEDQELTTRELSVTTKISPAAILLTMKYVDKHVEKAEYNVYRDGGRPRSTLKIMS